MNRFYAFLFSFIFALFGIGVFQTALACNNSYLSLDSVVAGVGNKYTVYFQFCVGGGFNPPGDTLQGADNATADFWFEVYGAGVILCPGGYPATLNSGQGAAGCTNCQTALPSYNSIGAGVPGCCACPCLPSPCPSGDSTCVWYQTNYLPQYTSLGFPFCPTCPGPPPSGTRFHAFTDIWSGSGPAQPWCNNMFLQVRGFPDSIRAHGLENTSGFFGYCLDVDLLIPTDALPVVWKFFEGEENKEESIDLRWSTAGEFNNSHFEIQKSMDGVTFRTLGTQEGLGDSQGYDKYSHTDGNPIPGIQFYRIKQIDFDGKFDYSDIIAVHFSGELKTHINYISPVPTSDLATISYYSSKDQDFTIEILDMQGKSVYKEQKASDLGENLMEIDVKDYNSGLYFLKIYNRRESIHGKILKQ